MELCACGRAAIGKCLSCDRWICEKDEYQVFTDYMGEHYGYPEMNHPFLVGEREVMQQCARQMVERGLECSTCVLDAMRQALDEWIEPPINEEGGPVDLALRLSKLHYLNRPETIKARRDQLLRSFLEDESFAAKLAARVSHILAGNGGVFFKVVIGYTSHSDQRGGTVESPIAGEEWHAGANGRLWSTRRVTRSTWFGRTSTREETASLPHDERTFDALLDAAERRYPVEIVRR